MSALMKRGRFDEWWREIDEEDLHPMHAVIKAERNADDEWAVSIYLRRNLGGIQQEDEVDDDFRRCRSIRSRRFLKFSLLARARLNMLAISASRVPTGSGACAGGVDVGGAMGSG